MNKIHKLLSRKNIYIITVIIILIFGIIYSISPESRDNIYLIIFNPFWPVGLGILELYIFSREQDIVNSNERKVSAVNGVLRCFINNEADREIIESVLDAMQEDDLLIFNRNKLNEAKIEKNLEEAGKISENSEGLNP